MLSSHPHESAGLVTSRKRSRRISLLSSDAHTAQLPVKMLGPHYHAERNHQEAAPRLPSGDSRGPGRASPGVTSRTEPGPAGSVPAGLGHGDSESDAESDPEPARVRPQLEAGMLPTGS